MSWCTWPTAAFRHVVHCHSWHISPCMHINLAGPARASRPHHLPYSFAIKFTTAVLHTCHANACQVLQSGSALRRRRATACETAVSSDASILGSPGHSSASVCPWSVQAIRVIALSSCCRSWTLMDKTVPGHGLIASVSHCFISQACL